MSLDLDVVAVLPEDARTPSSAAGRRAGQPNNAVIRRETGDEHRSRNLICARRSVPEGLHAPRLLGQERAREPLGAAGAALPAPITFRRVGSWPGRRFASARHTETS